MVIGGSASINAMVYLRGLKNDFDDWESFSSSHLGWDSVTSAYNEIEGIRKNSGEKRIYVSDVSTQHQAIVKNLADEFKTIWVPFQKVFDDALENAPVSYWVPDGVHPSIAGSKLMANAWLDSIYY